MSFLSKLGNILNASSGLIPVFGPLISVLVPKAAPTVQIANDGLINIATTIARIEALGQALSAPGVKKLEMAAPQVATILLSSPLLLGKKVKDPALFMKGVTEMSGGMADILNSIDEAEAVAPVAVP